MGKKSGTMDWSEFVRRNNAGAVLDDRYTQRSDNTRVSNATTTAAKVATAKHEAKKKAEAFNKKTADWKRNHAGAARWLEQEAEEAERKKANEALMRTMGVVKPIDIENPTYSMQGSLNQMGINVDPTTYTYNAGLAGYNKGMSLGKSMLNAVPLAYSAALAPVQTGVSLVTGLGGGYAGTKVGEALADRYGLSGDARGYAVAGGGLLGGMLGGIGGYKLGNGVNNAYMSRTLGSPTSNGLPNVDSGWMNTPEITLYKGSQPVKGISYGRAESSNTTSTGINAETIKNLFDYTDKPIIKRDFIDGDTYSIDNGTLKVYPFSKPDMIDTSNTLIGEFAPNEQHPVMRYYNDVMKPLFEQNGMPSLDMNGISFDLGEAGRPSLAGYFDPYKHQARIFTSNPNKINGVMVHEGLSHRTDDYISTWPQIQSAYKHITPTDVEMGTYGSFLSNPHSTDWREMRATINELRNNVYQMSDKLGRSYSPSMWDEFGDALLMNKIGEMNAYGNDYRYYYNNLVNEGLDKKAHAFADGIRQALKTLPEAPVTETGNKEALKWLIPFSGYRHKFDPLDTEMGFSFSPKTAKIIDYNFPKS